MNNQPIRITAESIGTIEFPCELSYESKEYGWQTAYFTSPPRLFNNPWHPTAEEFLPWTHWARWRAAPDQPERPTVVPETPCHICGQLPSEPGNINCSAIHATPQPAPSTGEMGTPDKCPNRTRDGIGNETTYRPQHLWSDGEFDLWSDIGMPTASWQNAASRMALFRSVHPDAKVRCLKVSSTITLHVLPEPTESIKDTITREGFEQAGEVQLAEKIVVELMEYDNMDFNDEEQHQHDRRVTFVSDALRAALSKQTEEVERLTLDHNVVAKIQDDNVRLRALNRELAEENGRLVKERDEAVSWKEQLYIRLNERRSVFFGDAAGIYAPQSQDAEYWRDENERLRAFAEECANDKYDRISGGLKNSARAALAQPQGTGGQEK